MKLVLSHDIYCLTISISNGGLGVNLYQMEKEQLEKFFFLHLHREQSLIEECSMAAKIFGIPQHSSRLSPNVKIGLVSFTAQRESL